MKRPLLATALLLIAGSAAAETCLLTYKDAVLLQGHCHFVSSPGGSFTIYDARGWQRTSTGEYELSDTQHSFAAMLEIEESGAGRGFANLDYAANDQAVLLPSTRFHADLGSMKRYGACWLSDFSAICAWR